MSWITDIAGKAENLLNQIDQNAATVLETAKIKSGSSASSSAATGSTANLREVENGGANTAGNDIGAYPYGGTTNSAQSAQSRTNGVARKNGGGKNQNRDDALIDVRRLLISVIYNRNSHGRYILFLVHVPPSLFRPP